jgi:probable O-glycosylation ligase (exosortase A-associated)
VRDALLTLIIVGLVPAAMFRPWIGVYGWYWIGYMNPHRFTWGFAYDWPFAQLIAIGTLVGLVVNRERRKFPWSPVTVLWLAFIGWVSVSTVFAFDPLHANEQWEKFIKIQLMTGITLLVINTPERIRTTFWVIVLSLGFFGVKGGVFTVITGGNNRVWGPPGSFIEGNNELALALIMTVPLMRYLQTTATKRWHRWGLAGAMLLSGFSILGSQSRGALIGGAAMAAALVFKSRHRVALGLLMVVFLGVLWEFAPEKWHDRMSTIREYKEDRSAMGRINAWHFAFNLANDHPLVGGGFGAFNKDLFLTYAPDPEDFHDSHSIYFGVLGNQGYVGLLLFVGLGVVSMRAGTRLLRATRDDPELRWAGELASMIQVSLIGFAAGGAFLGLAYFDLPYNLIALLVALQQVVRQEQARRRESPSSAEWVTGDRFQPGDGGERMPRRHASL